MFIIVNDNHMKKLLLCIFAMFTFASIYSQTSLEGKVTEKATGEPILFGTVALYKNGVLITGTDTDYDGNYFIGNLEPGTYDVESKYLGMADQMITGVTLKAGQTTRLNIELTEGGVVLDDIVVVAYKAPLVDVDNTSTGTTLTAEKIASLGVKNINSIVATAGGVSSQDGDEPSIRGSRSNETVYFIDGIRSFGTIPQSEVDQLQVLTGGIEAKYGDVTGGVISLTSKGPSEQFTGGIDLETSEFLDAYGYNLVSANLSGPILKNKKGKSILGFRVSGQYVGIDDSDPSAIGVYRAPESVVRALEENPFRTVGDFELSNAEILRDSDIGGPLKARPNDKNENFNITGKIDGRVNDNIDLSISGNFIKTDNQFTPGNNNIDNRPWYMFNWVNNPFTNDQRYRVNFRLRHKLGKQSFGGDKPAEGEKPSNIQNLQYTLQAGFERNIEKREDARHGSDLGNYGFMGLTPGNWELVTGFGPNPDPEDTTGLNVFRPLGYNRVEGEFVPGSQNPVLAKYNQQNGFLNSAQSAVWSSLYENVGQVYNNYRRSQEDLVTLNLSTGFDFLPGAASNKGRHSIQFGVLYEQRVNRRYSVTPFQLWRLGETLVNNHIIGLNFDDIVDSIEVNDIMLGVPNTLLNLDDSDKFLYSVRERLGGVSLHDYVNLSALDPSLMTIDLFSPQELLDNARVNYYGYDYTGKITTENTSFEDFFTARGEDGRRAFPVAPFTPSYAAVWLQDKFSYKDIIFRLGLRMDYYDANTKVLKDPYALYEIETAEDYRFRTGSELPSSVQGDYKVYVAGEDSDNVIGYRQGDTWFNSSGTQVANGNAIFNGGIVYPSYAGKDASGNQTRVLDIKDANFNPEHAFEDYDPQINWMPRLSFSFPISEDAGFFANYDILYSRPPSNSLMTALDYYNFENAGSLGVLDNSNLKPVRTTNYEVGFQQKISQTTAMKISAYYREIKDLIQRRAFANVPSPINNYEAFDNLDFGTTKGFTFQFDRRRTNNLELSATYTLQFAEGSGSDANSSSGINTRGPIRNLVPLSFDERHRITANADYRYQSGKGYDGPRIAGIDVFANTGLNLTAIAVSGRPYTQRAVPREYGGAGFVGSINGNRLPWTFNLDLRVDKRFKIKTSETGKPLAASVYFRVQNLLDQRNVQGVYSYSGDPDDDGYLLSSQGAARLDVIQSSGGDTEAFVDAYNWRLQSGGNYFRPRRMYLGITFNF
jgi:outer membrane receptor protein involved in Fe transport